MKQYSAFKNWEKKIPLMITNWMDLDNLVLIEISQKRNIYVF